MDEKIKGRHQVRILAPGKQCTLSLDSNAIFLVLHSQSRCSICYPSYKSVGLHYSCVSIIFLDPG